MNLEELLADPKAIVAAAALGASAFSTVHTFLDKHPRWQATLKVVAQFAGPLNLPAMRKALVALARAIVDAEDAKLPVKVEPAVVSKIQEQINLSRSVPAADAPVQPAGWPQR